MSSKTVKTESALKKAIESGVEEIIITDPDLIKKVHRLKQAKKASAAALTIAVGLIIAAAAAAPFTGGMSLVAAAPIAAGTGLSAGTIIAIAALITLGTVAIIAIMNDYEEIEISTNPPKLKLKKKSA